MSEVIKKQSVGIVTFDGGTIGYVGDTQEDIYEKVAKTFVEAWCHEVDGEFVIREMIAKGKYQGACSVYFEDHHTDSLILAET